MEESEQCEGSDSGMLNRLSGYEEDKPIRKLGKTLCLVRPWGVLFSIFRWTLQMKEKY